MRGFDEAKRTFHDKLGSMNDEMARAAPCDLSTDSPWVRCTFEPSSANFCRMSFSRRPSCGASTVMNRPLMPRFSACLYHASDRCSVSLRE